MERLKFASKVAGTHFAISLAITAILAYIVFYVWYPYPLSAVTGSFGLFWLLVSIDVVCGPLLTLLLSSPKKSRREMMVDLGLVITIQLSAFIYGMYHVYEARPVAVVFEVDRLRVLNPVDIATEELPDAPEGYRKLPLFDHFTLSTRQAKDGDDRLDAIDKSLSGLDIGQRPSWWIPYQDDLEDIKARANSVADLNKALDEQQQKILSKAVAKTGQSIDKLYYLPLTSALTSDWIALLDSDMNFIGAAKINAFALNKKGMDTSKEIIKE
ncbi:hypothetical protein KRX19_00670 [Cardiobacteriaceae bacterium TAE3-ERU3]|nr:hypothetical protein [Cardiobacteriaceae bacterium TAE3-ERU3]